MNDQVNELLRGGIDLHTHAGPGMTRRVVDDYELAEQAREAGMKGVLIKANEGDTTYRAALVSKRVPGIHVMGGIVLNHYVGGLNPFLVDLAVKTGAKMVWMPTIAAQGHMEWMKRGGKFDVPTATDPVKPVREYISIVDDRGKLKAEVHEILESVAKADVALSTSHLSHAEIDVLVDAAREAGVRKIIITHPDMNITDMPLSQQIELADKGAFIEKIRLCTRPKWGNVPIAKIAASIREIGAERCILVTDCGQAGEPTPVDGMKEFVGALLGEGISPGEIKTMLVDNPSYLAGLS